MNCVDSLVKYSVLNYPSIFPTRMHVLSHALLCNGTGFEWVERDGLLYLEQSLQSDKSSDTIKMNQVNQYQTELSGDQELDNHIRQWIQDNIDKYCLSNFRHNYTDRLLPRARYCMVSRNFNRYDDLDKFDKIAPEWLDAMLEVCEHYMEDIAKMYGGSPYLDCLKAIKCPMFREYYSFLQTQRDTIKALPRYVEIEEFGIEFTNKLLDKIAKKKKD